MLLCKEAKERKIKEMNKSTKKKMESLLDY